MSVPTIKISTSSAPKQRQAGKVLPFIAIAVLALGAGIFASGQFGTLTGSEDTTAQSTDSDNQSAQLAVLQESLKTSLALPTNFKSMPEFELLDANAQPITESVFDDKWSVIFFGYTHCPDVCPITLQVMKNVVEKLTAADEQTIPQIVFVSVDPVRDTSDIMKNYISFFDESFVGITGDVNNVHNMTRALGIVASFTANDTEPDNYLVDHTASLLLIDPQRRVRAKISPPHEADTIVTDYLTLIRAPS